ncbi:MAG: GTPase Era [Clostridia bacterium]
MINIYQADKHKNTIERTTRFALQHLNISAEDADIEVALVSESEIKNLNARLRGVDSVTDVLSFPSVEVRFPLNKKDYPQDINPENGAVILGEVYICVQRAAEQAEEYGHSLTREVAFLTAHGVLHLLGYDHEEDDGKVMEQLQDEILTAAGFSRDFQEGKKVSNNNTAKTVDKNNKDNNKRDTKDNMTDNNKDTANEFVADNGGAPLENNTVKTGAVAIIGRPNSGKSTLINTLTGEKVAIVSWKPQTTRNRILGIMNTDDAQVLFLDTPGLHAPRNALGKFMMRSVTAALDGVDIVLYVIDGEKGLDDNDKGNIKRYVESGKEVIVALNKIDHITRERAGEILNEISPIEGLAAVVPISALRAKNIEPLKNEIFKLLKEGERQYPEDIYTDKSMHFMAAETIREKTLRLLDQEIPFGIGVRINKYEVRTNGIIDIDADVICQKAAHKPIILGKGGSMIKTIATYSRQDLEEITGAKIFLTLWVRVKKDWRDDSGILHELGYNKDNY